MNLFYQPDIDHGVHQLSEDESRHAIKVLRLAPGDAITITDGKGFFYAARITQAHTKACTFEIQQTTPSPKKNYSIHIAISPTKNIDRTEWFLEKAIEIGIDKISFLVCENSERKTINSERMLKVAISAMKQSQQAWLPQLSPLQDLQEIVTGKEEHKFIAHVDPQNPHHLKFKARPGGNYLVMIGPEGDFTQEELDLAGAHAFQKISLGATRLRTETAGLVACHVLHLINLQ